MDDKKFRELTDEVQFRQEQLGLMYNLLVKNQTILYPVLHLFGLTGTGKTYAVKSFMDKFCNSNKLIIRNQQEILTRHYVYINCNELFYASISSLFNEILTQVKTALNMKNFNSEDNINMSITNEDDNNFEKNVDNNDSEEANEEINDIRMNDCACFLGQLRRIFAAKMSSMNKACLYLVFDNAESLKYFSESSNLLLTLSKLNEYLHINQYNSLSFNLSLCTLFLSECDWHSLISECDLMSKTESPRPFVIYFNEYGKEEMYTILKKTAIALLTIQDNSLKSLNANSNSGGQFFNVEFYIRIILDVFFPICKDLNEIQYLIQIYYDQLLCSVNANEIETSSEKDSYSKMLMAWNKMKPFLKQALTQIYLRQSMFNSTNAKATVSSSQSGTNTDDLLTREFENLNILSEKNPDSVNNMAPGILHKSNRISTNQLPKLMKYLLIGAYVATHNPAKYDRKLFEYNSTNKSRRSKFTAQKIQQNEENQRAAALKTQSFDVNRLMAIFFAILHENGQHVHPINLSQIQLNLKTLKSLHYLQQSNSGYSSLDEPKYKCLIDFETIQNLAHSVNFNIKQYLAEYISI